MKRTLLMHQRGSRSNVRYSANLRWIDLLTFEEGDALEDSLERLRALGYWASAFPEGDGVSFKRDDYDEATALRDVQNSFDWLEVVKDQGEGLAALYRGVAARVPYIVPVAGLETETLIERGPYKVHPAVDGHVVKLEDHAWAGELLDEPGADIVPNWKPRPNRPIDTDMLARLLGWPLLEGTLTVDAGMFFGSANERDLLLQLVLDHAELGLNLLRATQQSGARADHIPDHARVAYLRPDLNIEPRLLVEVPVLEVEQEDWV